MAVVVFDFQAVFAAAFCKTLMDRDFVVVINSELTPGRLEVHYRVCAHEDELYVRVIGVAAFCSEGFPVAAGEWAQRANLFASESPWLLASLTERANLFASGAFSTE